MKTYNNVNDAAQLLDLHFGNQEWVNEILISEINMNHPSKCILGQLFDNYYEGLTILGISTLNVLHKLSFVEVEQKQAWIDYIERIRTSLSSQKKETATVSSHGFVYLVNRMDNEIFCRASELIAGDRIVAVYENRIETTA